MNKIFVNEKTDRCSAILDDQFVAVPYDANEVLTGAPIVGMREPLDQYQSSGFVKLGPFLSDTDGKTVLDSLTIVQADVKLSKNNSTFTQKSDATTCAHNENGWYNVYLNSTDINTAGYIDILIDMDGALPVKRKFKVTAGS